MNCKSYQKLYRAARQIRNSRLFKLRKLSHCLLGMNSTRIWLYYKLLYSLNVTFTMLLQLLVALLLSSGELSPCSRTYCWTLKVFAPKHGTRFSPVCPSAWSRCIHLHYWFSTRQLQQHCWCRCFNHSCSSLTSLSPEITSPSPEITSLSPELTPPLSPEKTSRNPELTSQQCVDYP